MFEDGRQQRDFVHVHDVARACLIALESPRGAGEVFNIGSGESRSILSVAEDLATARKAASLVDVRYEVLPTVFSYDEALAPGAPSLHDDRPDNVACEDSFEWGDAAFGAAATFALIVLLGGLAAATFRHRARALAR